MSTTTIHAEMTPNPNAWKFIAPKQVIAEGSATYRSLDDASGMPLAEALIRTGHVTQVYFSGDFITITQDGDIDWNLLADVIRSKIAQHIETHDADGVQPTEEGPQEVIDNSEVLAQINGILDQTVRPALQGDGGDLRVINYDQLTHTLKIFYQGACGSCPSAAAGTMYAIQSILQETVDPEIRVVTA